nr:Rrf2 family transcriptional regulator [Marinobacter segnicrescens]
MNSTKFTTACYILSFVAYHSEKQHSSRTIAKWVNVNPSRVRQLISRLVQAGLLTSTRGGKGGVTMARAPSTVSLLDVFEAVAEPNVELFSIDNPFSDWKDRCYVHDVLSGLRNEMDRDFRNRLASIKVSSLYSADRALEKEGLADAITPSHMKA